MMAVHGAALVKSIVDDLAGGTTSIVVVPQNVDPSAVDKPWSSMSINRAATMIFVSCFFLIGPVGPQ